jgi:hypothetical protein
VTTTQTQAFIDARKAAEPRAELALQAIYVERQRVGGWQPRKALEADAAERNGRWLTALEVMEYEVTRASERKIIGTPTTLVGENVGARLSDYVLLTQFADVALPWVLEIARANLAAAGIVAP